MQDKILKLTNAVYKILEFFPESDPLKNKAKDKALAIMENPNQEDIDILLGYLWIAKTQGWLNSANYLIVLGEYEKIKKEIGPVVRHPSTSSVQAQKAPEPVLLITGTDEKSGPIYNLSPRQKRIIDFLASNEKAQVMDLQKTLPDVTKRTIRRDLDELLSAGKIARFGEFSQVFYRLSQMGQGGTNKL